MNPASVTLQSIEKPGLPLVSKPLPKGKIFIVHSVPLMRLAIETILSKAMPLAGHAIFSMSHAENDSLGQATSGDIVICDITTWTVLEKEADSAHQPHLHNRGIAVAIVASPDQTGTRLLETRGVSGVIHPDAEPQAFIDMAGDLLAGRRSISKSLNAAPHAAGLGRLSNRQFEILELMTRGLLNKQIAWELGLTEGTVKSHVSAILEKLGCDRRTQAITAFMQSLGVGRSSTIAA
ncbi:helix-turn-helix transcriptional regulator [Beijerinckia indica]|uniref:Transcriptional regulator, LuxR family n=1 Tax=Beijerinckia indica subsp. indica (strain ATCC 9039 / DSM 1715 / NCIMB 8712) TaxID=395963 RepID=B2IG80_BEII9|nr:response regulator transcription factor [Beijerinckia indica]ACB97154.1 transcriptional regulator, LuxR family [Beijerinckia indica subsp. indica ATCC 9039]